MLLTVTSTRAAPPTPAKAPQEARGWKVVEVADGIRQPWGMTWLADGRLIVTGKHGTLHVLGDGEFAEIAIDDGLPPVFSDKQGALMDVVAHPDDRERPRLYLTLATGNDDENRTVLVRGRLDGDRLTELKVLFAVEPVKSGGEHFGSRLLWLPDGTLLMSVGDGGNPPRTVGDRLAREQAQNLSTHLGSILRLTDEGQPAPDNPFVGREGARPEIWSYGHRNIQGLARDPVSGRVWANEHGPLGGDELNIVERGANYGWPLATQGRDYRTGERIGQPHVDGMIDPVVVWSPSPALSGLAIYTGDRFPTWRGSALNGGLVSKDVLRVALDADGTVTGQERIPIGSRVRDVRQGPDGFIYVLTDERDGRLLRIEPDQKQ